MSFLRLLRSNVTVRNVAAGCHGHVSHGVVNRCLPFFIQLIIKELKHFKSKFENSNFIWHDHIKIIKCIFDPNLIIKETIIISSPDLFLKVKHVFYEVKFFTNTQSNSLRWTNRIDSCPWKTNRTFVHSYYADIDIYN